MMHRRFVWVLVFLFVSVGSSFAQRDPSLISSRHYVGVELGANGSWLAGASNFFWVYTYPYSDDPTNPVIEPLAFSNFGNGIGFQFGATLDYALTDLISLQGKLFYRSHSTSSTEQQVDTCISVSGGTPGLATYESNYKMTLAYFGGNLGVRIQIIPESFYGAVGLDITSLTSNSFSGGETIRDTGSGCQFLQLPSGVLSGQTSLNIPKQTVNNFFRSTQFHIRLGLGTFIKLGSNGWVLTPELAVGIPLENILTAEQTSAYEGGYPSNNPFRPAYPSATPPKLWYASLSVGLKFPFGATSKEELPRVGGGEVYDSRRDEKRPNENKYTDLTGRVTDEKTGDPLPADVTVVDLSNNRVVKKSKTGSDGQYDVRVKAPGKYSVTADADNHLFGSTYFDVDDQGRILKGDHDIKLANANDGRTRLLIFFDFGMDSLKEASYPELQRAVAIMKADPNMQVEIAGYSDNVGTDEFNMDLSLRRANAVREYLLKNGIDPSRIAAKGYGKENPIAPNTTEEGRATNRRVEFVVLKK